MSLCFTITACMISPSLSVKMYNLFYANCSSTACLCDSLSILASQKERKPWLLPANICPIVPITFLKGARPI